MPLTYPPPEPLRAAEDPSFAHYSVVNRLPDIARRTIAENDFSTNTQAMLQALIDEIPNGPIRLVDLAGSAEEQDWNAFVRPYAGMNWKDIPWFFAEEYFYIRILEATGYFAAGSGKRKDPYQYQKNLGLVSTREAVRTLAEQITAAIYSPQSNDPEVLAHLLQVDLWGNQNDLSMWPVSHHPEGNGHLGGSAGISTSTVQSDGTSGSAAPAAQDYLLCNDLDGLLHYLSGIPGGELRVDLLVDNAGYELVADLALTDFLLSTGRAALVNLHVKSYPVFVSDAVYNDVHATLDFMMQDLHAPSQALAVRLRQFVVRGQVQILAHPFWTSPLAGWEMPDDLYQTLKTNDLLISKGDANYRRLLGDRHWPFTLPFSDVVGYLPSGVLSLRTLKSEVAVGIDPGRIPTNDPDWMINGRWGLIQFAAPLAPRDTSPHSQQNKPLS